MKPIIIATILLFTSVYAKASELQDVSVRLLWLNQFEFAGFYTAYERGYYEDVGLNVEIKEYEFGVDITGEVLSQESDFGVESSAVILDKMQGKDVYLLMATFQHSPFVLMAKKSDDLQSISDLAGKEIMLAPNQVTNATLNAMLAINNLHQSDYISVPHTFNPQDIIDGKADAMSAYVSNEPFYLEQKDAQYLIFDPADYGFAFYSDILFTSQEFAKQNPDVVDRFYEATLRGWEYSFANIDETVALIYNKYNTQDKTKEHLKFEALELKERAFIDGVDFGKFRKEIIAQIAQTYQLLNLSRATVDFDDLIYEKAIQQDPVLDYSLILKLIAGGSVLLFGLYLWNRKLSSLNKMIELKSQKLSTLLNNAKQGFLTFDSSFAIDSEYSKECEKLLGKDLQNKDVTDILFDDAQKKKFFKNTLQCAIKEKNPIAQNSILSLLPSLIILNKRALQIEYKIINENQIMMMITNISKQKKLEKKVKKEQQVLQMVVAVVSQSDSFYDIKNEFLQFAKNYGSMIDCTKDPQQNIKILYRIIHTFKGIFAQLYMEKSVARLHEIETVLSQLKQRTNLSNDTVQNLFAKADLDTVLDEDLQLIREILGEEFVRAQRYVKIDYCDIQSLQEKISKMATLKEYDNPECKAIITKIQELSSYKVSALLKPYENFVKQLAQRLDKNIKPLVVQGDETLIISKRYKPLFKSFVHLFRNCVDHGIEDEESRLLKQKPEQGCIECRYKQDGNNLIVTISDDGAGIDTQKIKQKLQQKGVDTTDMDEQDLMQAIFEDDFSTKEIVSETSGRGVGLGAIKEELESLGASVQISSQKDRGTTFEFTIPI